MSSLGTFSGRTIATALAFFAALFLGGAAAPRALAVTGSISGTVTDTSSHAGIEGVEVCAWKISGNEQEENEEHCVSAGAGGDYEIAPLSEGTYKVEFWPRGGGLDYVAQFYNGKRYWGEADPVYVGAGQTAGIDAALQEGGEIEGQVTSEVGGAPIEGVEVCAEQEEGGPQPGCDLTDANGRYKIVGLREGEYKVEFIPESNGLAFIGEFYNDEWSWPRGEFVPVSVGSVAAGINAALEPASEIRGTVTAAATGARLTGILVCIAPPLDYWEFFFSDFAECVKTNGSGEYSFGGLEAGAYRVMFSVDLSEYIHEIPPRNPEDDGYPTLYWNQKTSWEEADVLTLTAPTIATDINARLGPPAPAPIVVSPVLPSQDVITRRCKHGLKRKKVNGTYHCVRPHRRKHSPHHRHRVFRPAAALPPRLFAH